MRQRRRHLYLTGSGTVTGAVVIPSTLVEDYASLTAQTTGAFVGTLAYQMSNNGIDWTAIRMQRVDDSNLTAGGAVAAFTLRASVDMRYFRALVTAYTSGTITASVFLTDTQSVFAPRTTYPAT